MTIAGKLISQYHPWLYFLSIWEKRIRRRIQWKLSTTKFSQDKSSEPLAFRVKKHQSKLIRKLGNSDLRLQHNKVDNLKIVIARISGMIIHPGETFSFCKTVGLPTKKRGFKPGIELSFGEAQEGVGGGICQSSNLLHWLALHSSLTIVERHHHSFDPFPDNGRVLPFASGATVFYNYIDFQVKNETNHTFQLNLWLTDKLLEGEIRIDTELDYAFHVYEEKHAFVKKEDQYFRTNELWRKRIAKFESGKILEREFIFRNMARVLYNPCPNESEKQ